MRRSAKCVFLVFIQGGLATTSLAVDERNLGNWSNSMRNVLKNFASDVKGVTLIEYGLIAALIAVALATVLGTVGTNLNTLFTAVASKL
jgi:pilus assembly protein Flp/PilA